MVFRFSYDQNKELMRELIGLKPFAAKRGDTLNVWEEVAASLSRATKAPLNVKQIRDRLNVLKAGFHPDEAKAAHTSGAEESLGAVNVQSHHGEDSGLVREYISLEGLHQTNKQKDKNKKQRKRILHTAQTKPDGSDTSEAESTISSVSAATTTNAATSAERTQLKRSNAFLREIERQDKHQKLQLDLQERGLTQTQHRFELWLEFERQQALQRLSFEEGV
ncbi:hypothetical protein PC129_g3507 [Phytophthora cactorum]|uniref:Myb/SANT-like domain-containing protein n=1 Tax=Phytophthora cactorum TaxID=29920 RepID=A0A8T1CTD8_9STRA|nr:hypothetical protein PC115_g7483 [Phytophthora cactorum]KAG3099896.1 hypothetical protein PC122_g3350 [Phytophthora cactorum]KAG3225902.1 hypothetical protein PC129_g3507 [Phytophthora cactorum]